MAVVFIGAAMIIQITVSFLGVLLCANCCSGERAMGLCAFVFTLILLVILFAVPLGVVIVGWEFTFGDTICSSDANIFLLAKTTPY